MAKTNDCEATLRKGNLPPAEAVRTAQEVKGACVKAATRQNTSDEEEGSLAVIPNRSIPIPPKNS